MIRLIRTLFCHALIVAGLATLAYGATAPQPPRAVYDLNLDWKLLVGDPTDAGKKDFNDSAWKLVTLPRAWNEDEAFCKDIKDLSTGIAWYRKHFTMPGTTEDLANTKVFIEFEGVRQAAEVYVNGTHVGRSENGITGFGIDISAVVIPGENVIAVRTDNDWGYAEKATGQRYQWSDRNFNANYGGITKNVRLHVTKKLYQTLPLFSNLGTTGVYIYATDFDIAGRSAVIHAEAEVRNETGAAQTFELGVSLTGYRIAGAVRPARFAAPGAVTLAPGQVGVVKASTRVHGLDFWSWGHGALYLVRTDLNVNGRCVDSVDTITGFRKTEYTHGMITLNDRVIQMHGYAQRTSNEWPAIGLSVPAWLSDYSNGLMVESGGNLVRWMHITPWKQDVESSDRVGLIQAMPAGDSERDVDGRRWEQRLEVMRDAIIYNRNNPSILFYESGNKGVSEEHMGQMRAIRDQYDPHGGRASGSREMLNSRVAEYGGEMLYINKSARIPFWAMEYSRDEGLRKYWDEFSPPFHKDGDGPLYNGQNARSYNRNQDSHAIENIARWYDYWLERPGTGKRVSSGGVNIIFSDTNTHHRGEENYRRSGEVDAMRIAKDGFYAHQVMWDGWVDVEHPRAHIIGHWNYTAGTVKDVHVISSAENVELFLNGKSLGRGTQKYRFLFTFENVAWEAGELKATGYGANGATIAVATLQTAGEPAALRLTMINGLATKSKKTQFIADGHDLALVEVDVVDAQGRRCPTALDMVDFDLQGPAEWRGGIAQGPNNFILSKQLPVECGVNRVLVRTTRDAGEIILRAKSGKLRPAMISFKSVEKQSFGGLAHYEYPAPLGVDLRGPTPSTRSYKITRTPLAVVSATAGSNADDAAKSYDDDEITAWTSSDKIENAWIEYTLERPASLRELTLKLTGWRQRSYPIRVTLDGQEIYRGPTPKTLGYVTLAMAAPTKAGSKVRIELLGGSEARDAYAITELGNQKENASTGADKVGDTMLSIIEAEFYE